MGLFDKKTNLLSVSAVLPINRGDDVGIAKKVKTIFTDVETEGKKQGYERASAEYEPAYKKIKKEYDETKRALEETMAEEGKQVDKLVARLQQLESERDDLEKKIKNKTKKVSTQFNIPVSSVMESMVAGTLVMDGTGLGLVDLIYSYKEKKLRAAEGKGYAEAKQIYENKINELKENLRKLKKKGDSEIQEMMNLINDTIDEIIEAETHIAELEIVLNS
jgi:chromosome segregation ATPase